MYAHADFEDDETRRMIFGDFVDKIYVFDDKLIIDMFYSDNHVEVSLEAFLASEEYAKESIKDMELSVFDQNADGSINGLHNIFRHRCLFRERKVFNEKNGKIYQDADLHPAVRNCCFNGCFTAD